MTVYGTNLRWAELDLACPDLLVGRDGRPHELVQRLDGAAPCNRQRHRRRRRSGWAVAAALRAMEWVAPHRLAVEAGASRRTLPAFCGDLELPRPATGLATEMEIRASPGGQVSTLVASIVGTVAQQVIVRP